MTDTPSILMCAGRQDYKLHEFVFEAKAQGVSKRIPVQSVPEGLKKGLSKIFIAHPDAILKVTAEEKTLHMLAFHLFDAGLFTHEQWTKLMDLDVPYWTGEELKSDDFVPESMLDISMAFSQLPDTDKRKLQEEYGIEFCMGIIGYSPFSGFDLVLNHDEDTLPDSFAHLEGMIEDGYVRPVHVEYKEDKEDN